MLSLNQVIVLLHQSFYCPVSHALFHPIYSCGWTKFEQYSIYSIFLYSDNQLVCLLSKLERKCKIYTVTVVSRDVTVHREVAKNRYKCVTIGISKKKKKKLHIKTSSLSLLSQRSSTPGLQTRVGPQSFGTRRQWDTEKNVLRFY